MSCTGLTPEEGNVRISPLGSIFGLIGERGVVGDVPGGGVPSVPLRVPFGPVDDCPPNNPGDPDEGLELEGAKVELLEPRSVLLIMLTIPPKENITASATMLHIRRGSACFLFSALSASKIILYAFQ